MDKKIAASLTTTQLVEEIEKRENYIECMDANFGYPEVYTNDMLEASDEWQKEINILTDELETREDAPEEYKEMFEEERYIRKFYEEHGIEY